MDEDDLLHLQLAALGRFTSKKCPLKPEENLADDPMPENEPVAKPLPQWNLGDLVQNLGLSILVCRVYFLVWTSEQHVFGKASIPSSL